MLVSRWLLFLLLVASLSAGCASLPSAFDASRLTRTALESPERNAARLTFLRSGAAADAAILIGFQWLPNREPKFYTPRGALKEITLTEGGRGTVIGWPAILADPRLRQVEDLWPELVVLSSTRPGDYTLRVPFGVPRGTSGLLVEVRDYRYVGASNWTQPEMKARDLGGYLIAPRGGAPVR